MVQPLRTGWNAGGARLHEHLASTSIGGTALNALWRFGKNNVIPLPTCAPWITRLADYDRRTASSSDLFQRRIWTRPETHPLAVGRKERIRHAATCSCNRMGFHFRHVPQVKLAVRHIHHFRTVR